MKGITILEVIIVIAIITILSLIGINSINNFKKEVELDNIASELVSTIRLTRAKSMNGELIDTEVEENFIKDGMPEYGIKIETNSYKLIRKCQYIDGTLCPFDSYLEKGQIDSKFSLFPNETFYFERITGNFAGTEISILDQNSIPKRKIRISPNFLITTENL